MACSEFSLSKKYEDGTIYQQPFVDEDCIRTFVRHKGYWFPVPLFPDLQRFEQMRHFALKDNDILVASFPRSGTICILYYPNVTTLRSGLCFRKSVCRLSLCNVGAP